MSSLSGGLTALDRIPNPQSLLSGADQDLGHVRAQVCSTVSEEDSVALKDSFFPLPHFPFKKKRPPSETICRALVRARVDVVWTWQPTIFVEVPQGSSAMVRPMLAKGSTPRSMMPRVALRTAHELSVLERCRFGDCVVTPFLFKEE